MRIELHTDDGTVLDITEAVQIVYDTLHGSMEFGSGMLDTAEINALRTLSRAAGWDPISYGLDVCATCGHYREAHRTYGDRLCRRRECGCATFVLADTPTDPR